ncbi:hypothetical protein GCM10017786_19760 [Amycolatopsis deserti]|uniref:Uncharacterized protein n=1 Tax=Amycolatopsis deserti TaxID=185696 RepID=A0ABQ3ILJ9_9PSEU|nr:hypothetical protein [Amycolatopsis deserti]GHE87952.1 hypothetical protein GCM10017786_19760 [Amycolatopsis deserti]
MGWLYPFRSRPWAEIAAEFHRLADARPAYRPMAEVVDSVLGSATVLLGTTSLGDLIVVDRPVPRAPWGAVVVSGPWSRRAAVEPGWVRVEHVGADGEFDVRPVAEAVPLFWCFVTRKFGVVPAAQVS